MTPSSTSRTIALVAMVVATTGLATWLSVELVRGTASDAAPEVAVGEQATALEMKWSVEGSGDRFTPLPDPSVDMTFLPDLREVPTWKTGVPLTTNSAGMRFPREFGPKDDDTFRVIVLGDSFVASTAGKYEDGIAPQLEGMLQRALVAGDGPTRIEVYPLGVGGWNVISEVDYLIHNLHRFEPDVVLHVLIRNDLDNGFGFILGNFRSSTYDAQDVFGSTPFSISSPRRSQRRGNAKGLVSSYLIPESRRRYSIAAERISRLQDLLRRNGDAPYVPYVIWPPMTFGLVQALDGVVEPERILIAPPERRGNSLLPLDAHPNREGYRHIAQNLAFALAELDVLPLDEANLANEGKHAPAGRASDEPRDLESTLRTFEVDQFPDTIRAAKGKLRPKEAARTVVGGFYRGNVMSPHATIALRRPPEATHVDLTIEFPDVPALDGGVMRVIIDERKERKVPMSPGRHDVRVRLPPAESEVPLVQITFDANRYYTEPEHRMIDGVFGYAPKSGRLLRASVHRRADGALASPQRNR